MDLITLEPSTFEHDLLGFESFAREFEEFIHIDQKFVDGSLVVALGSKFGSGKSTFLRMWVNEIDTRNEGVRKPLVIQLNAWESDYYGDPLFAIISSLIEKLEIEGDNNEANEFKQAARKIGWYAGVLTSQVARHLTGIDALAAAESVEAQLESNAAPVQLESRDAFSVFQARKEAMKELKELLTAYIERSNDLVLFLVDELDRCRPDYAVTYLETIKHIFDLNRAVFVLAADREQLRNSAKSAFGPELDFDEYYRKFVHREVSLPTIANESYLRLSGRYVDSYLSVSGVRECFANLGQHVDTITNLIASAKLTPRQAQEIFRTLGHVFEVDTTIQNPGSLRWAMSAGTILMAVLKIFAPNEYRSLGEGRLAPDEAKSLFELRLKRGERASWWLHLLIMGNAFDGIDRDGRDEICQALGIEPVDQPHQWLEGWGHSSTNRFVQIFEKIENVGRWGARSH